MSGKADDIQQKEGHLQEHEMYNSSKAETKIAHAGADQPEHMDHVDRHAHMAMDFRKRFWILLALTLPILVLSPLLQKLVGLSEVIRFSGDLYVLFGFASAVFWYDGWPFLKVLDQKTVLTSTKKRRSL